MVLKNYLKDDRLLLEQSPDTEPTPSRVCIIVARKWASDYSRPYAWACISGCHTLALSLLVDDHGSAAFEDRLGPVRWPVLFVSCIFKRELIVRASIPVVVDLNAFHANES